MSAASVFHLAASMNFISRPHLRRLRIVASLSAWHLFWNVMWQSLITADFKWCIFGAFIHLYGDPEVINVPFSIHLQYVSPIDSKVGIW